MATVSTNVAKPRKKKAYSKINLHLRKEKDYRNLSMTQAGDTVKLKSNKIDNPSNPKEKLKRGDSIKTVNAGSREGAIGIRSNKKTKY